MKFDLVIQGPLDRTSIYNVDVISKQFESIKATVEEKINGNKINLFFEVKETEKFFVERINILGNNVTDEKVIRNQLLIDEGDPYNEILKTK